MWFLPLFEKRLHEKDLPGRSFTRNYTEKTSRGGPLHEITRTFEIQKNSITFTIAQNYFNRQNLHEITRIYTEKTSSGGPLHGITRIYTKKTSRGSPLHGIHESTRNNFPGRSFTRNYTEP